MATDVFTATQGSGTFAGVTMDDLRNITITRDAAEKQYASSSTSQQIKRLTGHKDESGSFEIYVPSASAGPDTVLGFDEGDSDTLVLKSASGQTLFNDTATILNIEYQVPIEAGDPVGATVTWGRT